MAKIDDLIRIVRPFLPSTTNNLQHLKRSRNIVGNGVGKYNDPLWSIGKTDKRPQNVNVLSQAEIDELNRANKARYQGLLDDQEANALDTPSIATYGDDTIPLTREEEMLKILDEGDGMRTWETNYK